MLIQVHSAMQKHGAMIDAQVPNLQEEARMLEWAGVVFGEEFTYKMSKSIKVQSIQSFHNI